MNGSKAVISQGTEIPYQSTDDNGKTETEFKKAELSLTVTPEINPDGSIFLQILAKNDSRGADVPTGLGSAPAIDTKTADTKVLVRDGETTVIGGIFVEEKRDGEDGVPYLMRIPILGHLFKSSNHREERRELLVFITPRILKR
jgi:type IV pilus assembly protein PilQ